MKQLPFVVTVLTILISLSEPVYATDVTVWAYRGQDSQYEESVRQTILNHIPKETLDIFNKHGGSVVITPNKYGKAGLTYNAFDSKGRAIFDAKCYMELTPDYGLKMMRYTVLHEFGHVLDMETMLTYDPEIAATIRSEVNAYNAVVIRCGYMIPEYYDEHELFAQVHAAVLGTDGTQPYAVEIINACPKTANMIKRIYGF